MNHQRELHDLSLHDLDTKFPIIFQSIEKLEVLRFGDLSLSVSLLWACTIITENLKTLRHLKLGAEGEVAWYEKQRTLYSSTYHWIAPKFGEILKQRLMAAYGNLHPVLTLTSLTLDGIEPQLLESRTFTSLFDWANLSAVTINSCSYLRFALNFLKSRIIEPSDGYLKATKLKSLDLRSDEKSSSGPVSYCFLKSFTGLVHLGLLLTDDQIDYLDLEFILNLHGPTLQSFIWDIRSSNHSCPVKQHRVNRFRSVQLICENCPHLVELGLTINWKDFHAGEQGCLEKVRSCPFIPIRLLIHPDSRIPPEADAAPDPPHSKRAPFAQNAQVPKHPSSRDKDRFPPNPAPGPRKRQSHRNEDGGGILLHQPDAAADSGNHRRRCNGLPGHLS